MATKFAGMVSETSVSFTGNDGKNHVISTGHPNNQRIRDLMRETQAAFRSGDLDEGARLWEELTLAADLPKTIAAATSGRVSVSDGEVLFDGEVLHNAITRRILWTIEQQFNPEPYMLFLDNLMENPAKRAVDELFGFMEACNMGVTEDGHLLAYKRVRNDYMDIYSGTKRNRIGDKPSMRRNAVDENKDRTCSQGLHFCSFSYLPSFGAGPGNRIMIVKVNPRDVVSVPSDYNNAKARTCLYEVIGEYEGDDIADILSAKPVWKNADTRSNFNPTNTRPDSESVLERLVRAINAEEGTELKLDADTELSKIPFGLRNKLHMLINDEFDIELNAWSIDDIIADDDTTLSVLVEEIVEAGGEADEDDTDEDEHEDADEREVENKQKTTLERLMEIVDELEWASTDESEEIQYLDFSTRVKLPERINAEFGTKLTVEDLIDDELTIRDIANRIDEATLNEAFARDASYIEGLTAAAEDDQGERAQSGEGPVVPVIDLSLGAAVTPASGKPTVTISPDVNGAVTRWVADCPTCNNGKGWNQTYSRKRDARKAIIREFGESVNIVEQG